MANKYIKTFATSLAIRIGKLTLLNIQTSGRQKIPNINEIVRR